MPITSVNCNALLARNELSSVEIAERIGVDGFERIARRALQRLFQSRVQRAFEGAYREFKATWRRHKELRKSHGAAPELRDALEGFGEKLGVDRATASRYLNGRIKSLPAQRLDELLRRVGISLRDVLPGDEEIKRVVLQDTLAAMRQARKSASQLIGLSDADFQRIDSLVSSLPIPAEAIRSLPALRDWITAHFQDVRKHVRNVAGSETENAPADLLALLTDVADWQTALKWLPWQLVIVFAIVEPDDTAMAACLHAYSTRDIHLARGTIHWLEEVVAAAEINVERLRALEVNDVAAPSELATAEYRYAEIQAIVADILGDPYERRRYLEMCVLSANRIVETSKRELEAGCGWYLDLPQAQLFLAHSQAALGSLIGDHHAVNAAVWQRQSMLCDLAEKLQKSVRVTEGHVNTLVLAELQLAYSEASLQVARMAGDASVQMFCIRQCIVNGRNVVRGQFLLRRFHPSETDVCHFLHRLTDALVAYARLTKDIRSEIKGLKVQIKFLQRLLREVQGVWEHGACYVKTLRDVELACIDARLTLERTIAKGIDDGSLDEWLSSAREMHDTIGLPWRDEFGGGRQDLREIIARSSLLARARSALCGDSTHSLSDGTVAGFSNALRGVVEPLARPR